MLSAPATDRAGDSPRCASRGRNPLLCSFNRRSSQWALTGPRGDDHLEQAERLASELGDLLAELAWRVRALEAEVASWALRERELRRELAGVRAGRPDPSEPSSLAEGELRDAISAARAAGRDRRPRWMDDLLGDPGREDQP
ncbi:MAG: hypothetical protein QOH11_1620 [Solirubrobacteraceae bacterium]|nr:hypothetical protein [Solirubrobacteraceae bacterium]